MATTLNTSQPYKPPFRFAFGKHLPTALTVVLTLLWAVPIVWATVVSFRPASDSLGRGDVWFGDSVTAESYERATELAPFFRHKDDGVWNSYYANTLKFVFLTLAVQLVTVTMAGFAFAHFEFFGKQLLFYFILLQLMIPTAILLVPNFITIREFSTATLLIPKFIGFREINVFDTPWAMAMPYFGSAFGTFLMRQAFLGVPRDLVDSGACGWLSLVSITVAHLLAAHPSGLDCLCTDQHELPLE